VLSSVGVRTPDNLASNDFWEDDYYRGITIPARPDPLFPYERCLARALEELAPVRTGATVLEVGCAPARWLIWYAERFGARVAGIEYSPKGANLSRANLAAAGLSGEIFEGDFFSSDFKLGEFDLVLSLGFIEHFQDIATVFERHVSFVAPGGRLLVGVPNFRGLIGSLQRWGDPGYLRLHNKEAMRPRLYERLATTFGMRLDAVRYINGPDPAMLRITRRSAHLVVLPLTIWRRVRLSDHVNGPFVSSYLVVSFTRPRVALRHGQPRPL
jgi:SAM-dependent methyltransferase